MIKWRNEIKDEARQAMKAQRGTAILVGLFTLGLDVTYSFQSSTSGDVAGRASQTGFNPGLFSEATVIILIAILAFIISSTIRVESAKTYTKIYRGLHARFGEFWRGLFRGLTRKLVAEFMVGLFTFLWSLLFVIPGIVKSIAYSMTPYLLAEYPELTAGQAIYISQRITDGYKGELFKAHLSFIGWILLSVLTLGLLEVFFVAPYYNTTLAGYYSELRDNALLTGVLKPEEVGTSEFFRE